VEECQKKMTGKTVLVTGCAGFIGSHLTEQLLQDGNRVVGVDNLSSGVRENMSSFISDDNFFFLEIDINDPELESVISEDIDTVYHLAAIASIKLSTEDPFLVHRVNVDGTLSILELARRRNSKRFVLSSSAAVYGNNERHPR
jgi:nucleoside-diphosphate-sugar epimerase